MDVTTNETLKPGEHVVQYDLLYSEVHGCYVRFLRWDCSDAVVCDRNTFDELPDYVQASQLRRC